MRFFLALEIPEESKQQLSEAQKKIKILIPQAKITDPDKLHLTIAFVGEQPDQLKERLVEIMKDAAHRISSFSVTPSYIDGFPHLHTANILWIGVKGEIDQLYELRHHIKDGLESLQLPVDERRFVPHIAIAKLKDFFLDPATEDGLDKIIQQDFTPISITSIKLFESIPNEGFHKHNTLAEIPLG
jgi:RNA 2',3'-cyclic 3'-phosphodiesterase